MSSPFREHITFSGKLAVQQRVLPAYRLPFFETLAARCRGGLALFAGKPLPGEGIPAANTSHPEIDLFQAKNLHVFNPQHPLFVCFQMNIVDWLENADPDALVVEANPRYLSNPAAIRWMQSRGRPVLGWGLGAPELAGPFKALRERSRKNLLARLDGIIAYSEKGAREYAELLSPRRKPQTPGSALHIFTAHNAVAPAPPALPDSPSNLPKNPLKILFVGRLQARKRLDLLFEACSNLKKTLRPMLTIVGGGPDEAEIKELAREIYPRTRFAGPLFGQELAAEFRRADLFVLPGTGGLALQEAMSHGLPVIAAQGDGTQEDLVRPRNGWLVEPGSFESLQAALRVALSSPGSLQQMGRESFRIVSQEINIDTMADKFAAALQACSRENDG